MHEKQSVSAIRRQNPLHKYVDRYRQQVGERLRGEWGGVGISMHPPVNLLLIISKKMNGGPLWPKE